MVSAVDYNKNSGEALVYSWTIEEIQDIYAIGILMSFII